MDSVSLETRRQFFGRSAKGLGLAALASLVGRDTFGEVEIGGRKFPGSAANPGLEGLPHFAPKAKRATRASRETIDLT